MRRECAYWAREELCEDIKERVKDWAREELSQGHTLSALDLWLEFQQQLEGEISRLKAQAADPEARKPFDESIAVLLEECLERLRHNSWLLNTFQAELGRLCGLVARNPQRVIPSIRQEEDEEEARCRWTTQDFGR